MMRHADSESSDGRDFDRSITAAGRDAARQVAEQLAARGWLPDLILCSDSTRTQQTLFAMQAAVGALQNVRTLMRSDLYTVAALDGHTRKHLEDLIAEETAAKHEHCVMCLGHNKGWEEAASSFVGRSIRLKPANAALLQGRGATWQAALSGQTYLDLIDVLLPLPATDAAPEHGIPSMA